MTVAPSARTAPGGRLRIQHCMLYIACNSGEYCVLHSYSVPWCLRPLVDILSDLLVFEPENSDDFAFDIKSVALVY